MPDADALPRPILLSPPHPTGEEAARVAEEIKAGWMAPAGPAVEAFEGAFADAVGAPHAVAVSSGTAALHLALRLAGVGPGDRVAVSTLTFCASVNPILYLGATPVFVDSETASWNLDPNRLEAVLRRGGVRAVVAVHLYGQAADLDAIAPLCERYGAVLVEDAAEALGATHRRGTPGTVGAFGVFSFNGNKILSTAGGGMLVTPDAAAATYARRLAAQAREPALHYEHREVGYNYRLSGLLAAVGLAQLPALEARVAARRANFDDYRARLAHLTGVAFMPEAPWGRATRWLTCLTLDPAVIGTPPDAVCRALAAERIEARPVWKPMHRQPVYAGYPAEGGAVADDLFARGLCLPSGSALTAADRARVADALCRAVGA